MRKRPSGHSIWISAEVFHEIQLLTYPRPPRNFIRTALAEAVEAARNNINFNTIRSNMKRMESEISTLNEAIHNGALPVPFNPDTGKNTADAQIEILQQTVLNLLAELLVTTKQHYADYLGTLNPPQKFDDKATSLARQYEALLRRIAAKNEKTLAARNGEDSQQ